ncbi:MAG: phage tail protein [Terriglobia bacterium]
MSEPFLSEIKLVSFGFPPKGWALCNGQLLPINQNQALFSLLGTTYGGDGRINFGLPNLQGRVPIHMGDGYTLGELGGEQNHTLSISEMPGHTHTPVGANSAPDKPHPTGNTWANTPGNNCYAANANSSMNPTAVTTVGGSQAHLNMQPYLTLNFIIALQGIFPSQN